MDIKGNHGTTIRINKWKSEGEKSGEHFCLAENIYYTVWPRSHKNCQNFFDMYVTYLRVDEGSEKPTASSPACMGMTVLGQAASASAWHSRDQTQRNRPGPKQTSPWETYLVCPQMLCRSPLWWTVTWRGSCNNSAAVGNSRWWFLRKFLPGAFAPRTNSLLRPVFSRSFPFPDRSFSCRSHYLHANNCIISVLVWESNIWHS